MAPPSKSAQALKSFDGFFPKDPGTREAAGNASDHAPPTIAALLRRDGLGSYGRQALWTCNPAEWAAAATRWLPGRARADAYLRTAFGDLFIWDGEMFWFAMVHEGVVAGSVDDDAWFLSRTLGPQGLPSLHQSLPHRIARAKSIAGELAANEMYAYVPALALGGTEEDSRIVRVPALEHLAMLAELGISERP